MYATSLPRARDKPLRGAMRGGAEGMGGGAEGSAELMLVTGSYDANQKTLDEKIRDGEVR